MVSKQEIYNRVKEHLLTQNARSTNVNGDCMYRGPNGLKCAVGYLIEDEHYHVMLEGFSIDRPYVKERVARSLKIDFKDLGVPSVSEPICSLLRRLQSIHDYEPVYQWEDALKKVALDFGLEP